MHIDLLVIYTDQLEACHAFYTGLGLSFTEEQHGAGPAHYATVLDDDAVFELYPSGPRRPATGPVRLGFTTRTSASAAAGVTGRRPGRQVVTDPDGRTVVLTVPERDRR